MDWIGNERRRGRKSELTLVDEASAFLTGQLVYEEAKTPVWARLNMLAHARPSYLLHQWRLQLRTAPRPLGSWARTQSDILGELLELTGGRPERIEQLQRACLIPLEVRLMAPSFRSVDPSKVLVLALTRLRAHPIATDHRASLPPDL